jgi:hypothetical protein
MSVKGLLKAYDRFEGAGYQFMLLDREMSPYMEEDFVGKHLWPALETDEGYRRRAVYLTEEFIRDALTRSEPTTTEES